MKWKCYIPGKEKTEWQGGLYPLTMEFTEDYPAKPPKVRQADSANPNWNSCCASHCSALMLARKDGVSMQTKPAVVPVSQPI